MDPAKASGPATESVNGLRAIDLQLPGRIDRDNTQNPAKPQDPARDPRRRKGEADISQRAAQRHGSASTTHPKAGPNGACRRTSCGDPESNADRVERGYDAGTHFWFNIFSASSNSATVLSSIAFPARRAFRARSAAVLMRLAVALSIFPLARSLAAFMAIWPIDSAVIILYSLIWRAASPPADRVNSTPAASSAMPTATVAKLKARCAGTARIPSLGSL
jgi:hypothetical protein